MSSLPRPQHRGACWSRAPLSSVLMVAPLALVLLASCSSSANDSSATVSDDSAESGSHPEHFHVEVIETLPWDSTTFTQGLDIAKSVTTSANSASSTNATNPAASAASAASAVPATNTPAASEDDQSTPDNHSDQNQQEDPDQQEEQKGPESQEGQEGGDRQEGQAHQGTHPTFVVGSGRYGQSRVYTTTADGQQGNSHDLDPTLFGEGVAATDSAVWQLTWKAGIAIKRDPTTLEEIDRVRYDGEGWGLCYDGTDLVMSDGSSALTVRDATTFAEKKRINVTLDGHSVEEINELDCAGGRVLANIWHSDDIYRIDPASGKVTGIISAAGLHKAGAEHSGEDVLNGIAADPQDEHQLYLTGKLWPNLFRVRVVKDN